MLTRVGLVLIRVDSCQTRVDLCWLVSDSCWFVLTRGDLCWYSCIRIDLINKTSCKHSHKKRKVYYIIDILCGYPNFNAQGALVIIFFICSDLFICLRNPCTVAIRKWKWKRENPHCKQPFHCFDVFPVWPPQKFQVQIKVPTIWPVFPDYIYVFNDYAVKLQTCVTNEVVYYLSSIKDFQKNTETLFRDRYSTKIYEALYIFKIRALYFFSQLLCCTVFEHDKYVMITMLNNKMEGICFESIHDDKKKAEI